jgi:hypothetical protein
MSRATARNNSFLGNSNNIPPEELIRKKSTKERHARLMSLRKELSAQEIEVRNMKSQFVNQNSPKIKDAICKLLTDLMIDSSYRNAMKEFDVFNLVWQTMLQRDERRLTATMMIANFISLDESSSETLHEMSQWLVPSIINGMTDDDKAVKYASIVCIYNLFQKNRDRALSMISAADILEIIVRHIDSPIFTLGMLYKVAYIAASIFKSVDGDKNIANMNAIILYFLNGRISSCQLLIMKGVLMVVRKNPGYVSEEVVYKMQQIMFGKRAEQCAIAKQVMISINWRNWL